MDWFTLYPKERQPSLAEIASYIDTDLWQEINGYLQEAYQTQPKMAHSGCSGQPGWNVKYQKAGKSLCTLYPLAGYFIALVVIGVKEQDTLELILPTFTPYIQALYQQAGALMGAKWLMIEVREEAVLEDVKRLIALRRAPTASAPSK